MPKSGVLKRIKEKERGLVPSRACGAQDETYGSYLNTLDPIGNASVRHALACSSDVRFQVFLERISDPHWIKRFGKAVHLQTIAKGCGISLREFNDWGQNVAVQRSLALAQLSSPKLTEDMSVDAQSTMISCERCDGLTWVSAPEGLPEGTPGYRIWKFEQKTDADGNVTEHPVFIRNCPVCAAAGKVRAPGDEFSREKLLDMSGLISKKGPMVAITQNFSGQNMSSAVTRLEAITVDVEPVSARD